MFPPVRGAAVDRSRSTNTKATSRQSTTRWVHGCAARRGCRHLHGRATPRGQRAVPHGDGNEHAIHRAGIARHRRRGSVQRAHAGLIDCSSREERNRRRSRHPFRGALSDVLDRPPEQRNRPWRGSAHLPGERPRPPAGRAHERRYVGLRGFAVRGCLAGRVGHAERASQLEAASIRDRKYEVKVPADISTSGFPSGWSRSADETSRRLPQGNPPGGGSGSPDRTPLPRGTELGPGMTCSTTSSTVSLLLLAEEMCQGRSKSAPPSPVESIQPVPTHPITGQQRPLEATAKAIGLARSTPVSSSIRPSARSSSSCWHTNLGIRVAGTHSR